MKTKIKLGEYGLHPRDAKETIVEFPDDTIFFTGNVEYLLELYNDL